MKEAGFSSKICIGIPKKTNMGAAQPLRQTGLLDRQRNKGRHICRSRDFISFQCLVGLDHQHSMTAFLHVQP